MFTSSDKAVEPINLYGATKLCAEKMIVQANIGRHRTTYACCRYGNVLASNGSVIQKWRNGWNSLTKEEMTRFFITPKNAAEFVYRSMRESEGAEIFIPKMKSTTMLGLWWHVCGEQRYHLTGSRPGEKMHECLISPHEDGHITDLGWAFVRWPEFKLFPSVRRGRAVSFPEGFTSLNAERFTKEELEGLCRL
jgi:FlaA1/EpsC-like NDP-sugar epimerase